MPSFSVLKTVLRELITFNRSKRENEPDLVMDDPDKVAAFTRAGREDGVMAPVYLYHCAQICEILCPGDTVVDLGCGPATQIAMVARLNPNVNFIGVDLSPEMLKKAESYCAEQKLDNIKFYLGDISDLSTFEDASVDVVTSTVALHHLPDLKALEKTFSEIKRILKKEHSLYLADFGHLKSEKSIKYFAYQYAHTQPELFTLDYLYSLRAAFSKTDFKTLTNKYFKSAKLYSTFIMPFFIVIKSQKRQGINKSKMNEIETIYNNLPDWHKTDLADLKIFFRMGGLKSVLLN